ncbi:MAG: OmpH family outer membrane protein [Verrucomicrobiales bacterium]
MARSFTTLTLCLLLVGFASSPAHAQKIGTVDMNEIFNSYHKTKDAEQRINEAQANAKKEFEERLESQRKVIEVINKLQEESRNPALSDEAREQKDRAREEKIAEARNLEREIQEFRATRERQLAEQAARMRNNLVEEISQVIETRVQAEGFDLVFDVSGKSLNGVSMLLFAKEGYDFSDSVITELNKGQ